MDPSAVRRVAEVRLRGRVARAYWPAPAEPVPALLVFFGGTDELCRQLCTAGRVLLLSLTGAALEDAAAALNWAADHAGELGADPGRLLVGGAGAGAGLATAVALHASDQSWPVITRQLLVDPDIGVGPAGVAPATVISAGELLDLTNIIW